MKSLKTLLLIGLFFSFFIYGCESKDNGDRKVFDINKEISVISREDGSGTRGAFIELFEIEKKGDDGSKKDRTTKEAIIVKQTDIMMSNVSNNLYSIGYLSLGSINDSIKTLKIDNVEVSAENIKNGSYKISRPFNIVVRKEVDENVKDFIDFILSSNGQDVVSNTYIRINDDNKAYKSANLSGKIVIAGSSSVSPLMEKLVEEYKKLNPDIDIEIQTNDSSSGIKSTIDGNCDIGMASRNIKDSEKDNLNSIEIALDGIAVIVNKDNPQSNLSKDEINKIFTGEILNWSEVIK